MKKTLIALFALAACAQAVEITTTTYTPFNTTEGWVLGTRTDYSRPIATIDAATQSLYNNACNWGQDYAVYTFASPLAIAAPAHSLAFSYDIATNGTVNAAVTLTLIDSTANKVVCVGMGKYNDAPGLVQYGTGTTLTNNLYNFQQLTAAGTLSTMAATDAATITGTLAFTEEGVVATFGDMPTKTVNLGESFNIDKVAIFYDCGSSTTTRPVFSNLSLTHSTPEPATATLSLLALAGLASRRRRH